MVFNLRLVSRGSRRGGQPRRRFDHDRSGARDAAWRQLWHHQDPTAINPAQRRRAPDFRHPLPFLISSPPRRAELGNIPLLPTAKGMLIQTRSLMTDSEGLFQRRLVSGGTEQLHRYRLPPKAPQIGAQSPRQPLLEARRTSAHPT